MEFAPNAFILFYHSNHFGLPRLFQFSFSPWCFCLFLCSFFLMLLSTEIATSVTAAVFCSLSTITMCVWLTSSCLFVWNLKSYSTLALVSPTTFSVISHQELKTSNSHVSHIFLYTIRLSVYHLSLHITSCYMLLDSLQGTFAQAKTWVFLAVVDSCFHGSWF